MEHATERMTMLIQRNPGETYRRIDFDARVEGADPQALVSVCYETLITSLGSALFADQRNDSFAKSAAMTRALGAVTALKLGISGANEVTGALHHFLESARRAILDSALAFDANRIATLRDDFADIATALRQVTT